MFHVGNRITRRRAASACPTANISYGEHPEDETAYMGEPRHAAGTRGTNAISGQRTATDRQKQRGRQRLLVVMNRKTKTSVLTLALGNNIRSAPRTPETAPLAPIIGTGADGSKEYCTRARGNPGQTDRRE